MEKDITLDRHMGLHYEVRKAMTEIEALDVPFAAEEFRRWLMTNGRSEQRAGNIIESLRCVDAYLWRPEEIEVFQLLGILVNEGINGSVIGCDESLATIDDVLECVSEVKDEFTADNDNTSRSETGSWLSALRDYKAFISAKLKAAMDAHGKQWNVYVKKLSGRNSYPPVPLEDEFREWMLYTGGIASTYMSRLRRFNAEVLMRNESTKLLLEDYARKAEAKIFGDEEIRKFHSIFNELRSRSASFGFTNLDFTLSLTAVNTYLDFIKYKSR